MEADRDSSQIMLPTNLASFASHLSPTMFPGLKGRKVVYCLTLLMYELQMLVKKRFRVHEFLFMLCIKNALAIWKSKRKSSQRLQSFVKYRNNCRCRNGVLIELDKFG